MTSNFNFLLFISLVSSAILQCHAQLNGLPQSTLHAIASDTQSASQPTAMPPPPETNTGMEPGGEPVSAPESIDDTAGGQPPPDSSQVEPTISSEDTATSAGGHLTVGIGASQNGSEDNGHLVSSAGGGISVGAVVAIIVAALIVITACATLLLIRRRRQQRTRRAAAGMRQLKLGGSHVKVQTAAISKPMPVQLGVGYSQHYKAQGYEPDSNSYYSHSRGSSLGSHEQVGERSDMYSTIKPGMAGIGTQASIHSSLDTVQSRWSP